MSGKFAFDLSRFVAKAKGNVDLVVRKVSFDIMARVVMKTPVDTGRARGNWMCGIGTAPMEPSQALDTGGGKTIERVSTVIDGAKAGTVVFLTNTLPYILALEQGSSRQAPAGMLATTLREFPGVVEQVGREVSSS